MEEIAHWVPKSLSNEQMATRASVCSALLKRYRLKDDFLLCLMTVDETWVHYYEPVVGPKKFKTQSSAGKVMATVFWDAKGLIMLDFLPKRSTITGVYYANLLDQLRTTIHEKTPFVKKPLKRCFAAIGQCESPHLKSCSGCYRAKRE